MIAIGCDHAGYEMKKELISVLGAKGYEFKDSGCDGEKCDYPDIAEKVCGRITSGEADRGILMCGTGIGISMAANKIKGIRAALCGDVFSARMSREHNDANVLAMGGRVTGIGPAGEIVRAWLTTPFSNGERHIRRIKKMMALENK